MVSTFQKYRGKKKADNPLFPLMRFSITVIFALSFTGSLALSLMDAIGGGVGDAVFADRNPEGGKRV